MINVTSASDDNKYQCYHNNKGFCKFRDQCHYQHYSEICQKSICRDKKCSFRHPKICRNGEKCKFLKLKKCAYRHSGQSNKMNHEKGTLDKKVDYWEDQIAILKVEIIDLKNSIEKKTKEFEALAATGVEETKKFVEVLKNKDLEINTIKSKFKDKENEFKVLMDENDDLKVEIKNLKAEKVDLVKKLELKDSLSNFACTKCEYSSKKEYDLEIHISTNHPANSYNKCHFQTEGENQVENLTTFLRHLSIEHLSGKKSFKCSDFIITRTSTKMRKSKDTSTC